MGGLAECRGEWLEKGAAAEATARGLGEGEVWELSLLASLTKQDPGTLTVTMYSPAQHPLTLHPSLEVVGCPAP